MIDVPAAARRLVTAMPTLIRIETETGGVVDEMSDDGDVLTWLAGKKEGAELALAHMIDPRGNTVFNGLQVPSLLRDIELLIGMASPEERKTLEEIAEFAQATLAKHHLYLKFYGD
jgi:hypothetical protein